MKIIDFHTHPFISKDCNVCFYENTVNDYNDFFAELKRAEIDRVCGSVIKKKNIENFDEIKALNDDALRLAEISEGFYIPGIHIHPSFVEESAQELERMSKKGVRLVGELVPYFMGWESYYDKNMHEIYEAIDSLNMVVSLHTMNEETIDDAVRNFPNITFVMAHPNDKACFLRHIERMKKYENCFLDLSGTGIFRYGLIGYGIKEVGSERFLFGTDFPICNPSMYVNAVRFEKLSDSDYENIFFANAERILGLA